MLAIFIAWRLVWFSSPARAAAANQIQLWTSTDDEKR